MHLYLGLSPIPVHAWLLRNPSYGTEVQEANVSLRCVFRDATSVQKILDLILDDKKQERDQPSDFVSQAVEVAQDQTSQQLRRNERRLWFFVGAATW